MKAPPWTLLMPLRCFFSTRKAQRIWPSSSIRCQNGPLWDSKLSRLQVRQPLNSPSVPTCRSGRLRDALLVRSATRFGLGLRYSALKSDRSEEHTSELQSRQYVVCRLLLQKKKYGSERRS